MPRLGIGALLLLVVVGLGVPRPGLGAHCEGVGLAEAVEVAGRPLGLNGAALRSVSLVLLELRLYVAALYLERPARDPRAVLDAPGAARLALHFQRDVPRARLTEGFGEAVDRAAPGDASLRQRFERLNGWMEDMRAGDALVFDVVPGVGVAVSVAGRPRGVVPGADFARVLLGNWLGPHAVDRRVEAGLMGAPCD